MPVVEPAPLNYFKFCSAATRYAAGRPFFHPIVADAIRARLGVGARVGKAIDVACGTGLSTRILTEFAEEVVGTDISEEMLGVAFQDAGIRYVCASAEAQPFAADEFDLMTVALAFHWLDRERFLAEAHRVLRAEGMLVIYNHAFHGEMACGGDFSAWNAGYVARYPTPPRDKRPFTAEDARAAGFHLIDEIKFSNHWPFTVEELAAYLVTQSNVIAAVEAGSESIEAITQWMRQTLTPLFRLEREVFRFRGSITMLRKETGSAAGSATVSTCT